MTGRKRKSKRYTRPPNLGAASRSRPLSPNRMRRFEELTRVATSMGGLLLLWRARVDAPGALAIASAWEPAMPRAGADAVSAGEGDLDGVECWAIHWAITAWLCRLSLPSSESELWG